MENFGQRFGDDDRQVELPRGLGRGIPGPRDLLDGFFVDMAICNGYTKNSLLPLPRNYLGCVMGFFDFLFGGSGVKFKKKYTENRNTMVGPATYHYEVYTGKTAQEARDFLNTKTITAANTYCIVETPEGNWGKDKDGMYKENS